MPTAAKLISGLGFCLTAIVASWLYFYSLPATSFTVLELMAVSAVMGFALGWFLLGPYPGYGGFDSLWAGLRAAIAALLLACLLFGLIVVSRGLINGSYLDPVLPLKDVLRHGLDFLISAMQVNVLVALGLGALITGRLAGLAYTNWQ